MLPAKTHRLLYLVLLTLLGGSMVTSVWMANLVWVLLAVNWLLEGRWAEKWRMARQSRLLHAYLVLYLLHLVGLLWTSHTAVGWAVLRVELPLLAVPAVLLTTPPPEGRARRLVLGAYVSTVVVVSFIGLARLLLIPTLPYREAVPYISHIRFALNCCMVIVILLLPVKRVGLWPRLGLLALVVWMVVFLFLIRSYTALAVLLAVSFAMVFYKRRWTLAAVWLVLLAAGAVLVAYEVRSYYRLVPQATEPLLAYTPAGHPYEHACDGIVENGNYINNYVCHDEMRSEWKKRSSVPYDTVFSEGCALHSTLIRYLNAMQLTKDSAGVAALSDEQVAQVEQGVANPVYTRHNPLRKMVYVILFEREHYLHTHAVRGFSMLQRFELWRAAAGVIADHRWIGVGTGDVDAELHAELRRMDSPLASTSMRTHNQYLAFLAAFGVIGFALILFFFLRALTAKGAYPLSPLMLAWLLIVLISFLTEDTLDTLPGILFCTYFLAYRNTCTTTTP